MQEKQQLAVNKKLLHLLLPAPAWRQTETLCCRHSVVTLVGEVIVTVECNIRPEMVNLFSLADIDLFKQRRRRLLPK